MRKTTKKKASAEEPKEAKAHGVVPEHLTFKSVKLSAKQKTLFNKIKDNKITIVTGPAGTAKAQPLDAPILTPDGWIRMGDIEVGDRVISADGNQTIVTGVFPQGEKEIWELTFSDGARVECCQDHLWFTQTESDRNYRKWSKTVNGVRKRYKSEKEGGVKTTSEIVDTLYTRRGRINHTIPITEPVNFKERKVEIDPYVMGCLLGDGCFRKGTVKFSTADQEIVDSIQSLMDEEITVKYRGRYDYALVKEKTAKENKLKKYLTEIGLMEKMSHDKFIPDCYKFNTVENRISLLRGLMDTDGSVDKKGINVCFSSTSKRLIDDVKEIVQSLGGLATDYTPNDGFYYSDGEKKVCRTSYRISIKMNPDINPFSLTRKSGIVVPKTKYRPTRYIVSARLVGKKEAQCIMVSNDSHLYLTNDYVVTHNTFCACFAALKLLNDKFCESIIITKPTEIVGGTQLGHLPGTLDEKLLAYMESFKSVFSDIIDPKQLDAMIGNKVIEYKPVQFVRGITFNNSVVIVDEFQSFDIKELMAIVTRMGKNNCKMIFIGDVNQNDIDKRYVAVNIFKEIIDGINGTALFEFDRSDIVRDEILIEITDRYNKMKEEGRLGSNKKNT